jgi:hypothetical protein
MAGDALSSRRNPVMSSLVLAVIRMRAAIRAKRWVAAAVAGDEVAALTKDDGPYNHVIHADFVKHRCNAAPLRWVCTRPRGHEGPCAAVTRWPEL